MSHITKRSSETTHNGSVLPLISVITPSLNQADYLERTIESVLSQGYPNLEYIVMDGGSTDGSIDIIKKYSPSLTYWTSGPDGGQGRAIMTGFGKAQGMILGYVNSDDILLPGALNAVGEFFRNNRNVDLLVGKSVIIDLNDRITYPVLGLAPSYNSLLFWGSGGFNQPACFWRREALFSVGLFDPALAFCFDYDLFLRLTRNRKASSINYYLAAFRMHSANKTSTLKDIRKQEDDVLQHRYGIDRYPIIFRKLLYIYYRLRYLILAGWFRLKICLGMETLPELPKIPSMDKKYANL